MTPSHRATDFKRISLRATGGKVRAIFWHLGVRAALEDRGFTFRSGFGPLEEATPGQIGLLVGSSAGSVFSILAAAGYDIGSILNSFIGRPSTLPRIDEATIFHRRGPTLRGYFRRIRSAVNLRAGAEIFPGTGVGSAGEADDPPIRVALDMNLAKFRRYFRLSDLLVFRARYSLAGMEKWFSDLLGDHDHFEELRTQLFVIASDLDQPQTAVFGRREKNCVWYRYVKGVPISRAAVASMAIPSIFNPISIRTGDRKHYFIDGDVYNPTETMIESDHHCDLAIISSFEAPYRFHPAIGSLHHLGLPYEITQTIALAIYSRFMQSRNLAKSKGAAMDTVRNILAKYVDEETLDRECRRVAAALDMSLDMKVLHLHPFKNPLLFFGDPFDLSSRTLAKMMVEASLQASDLLDRAGFTA